MDCISWREHVVFHACCGSYLQHLPRGKPAAYNRMQSSSLLCWDHFLLKISISPLSQVFWKWICADCVLPNSHELVDINYDLIERAKCYCRQHLGEALAAKYCNIFATARWTGLAAAATSMWKQPTAAIPTNNNKRLGGKLRHLTNQKDVIEGHEGVFRSQIDFQCFLKRFLCWSGEH